MRRDSAASDLQADAQIKSVQMFNQRKCKALKLEDEDESYNWCCKVFKTLTSQSQSSSCVGWKLSEPKTKEFKDMSRTKSQDQKQETSS